ncbi:hypothetical protein [Sorangium sp. So ce131]|uniref:hypothetical protein n=1 Tax=Sorangium sp. So ce131 TaxID=3133282 RepID=UPI003F5ED618
MGHGANMTINNFSPYNLQVAVVRKHCIYPQGSGGAGAPGIDAFNKRLTPAEPTFSGYIENKNTSTGGDLCATDTGYFELSFTVMRGDTPDPRYTPSSMTIAIPHDHFQKGDNNSNGAVKVELSILNGTQDTISVGLKDNV